QPDTIIVVEVAAPRSINPSNPTPTQPFVNQLRVTVTAGAIDGRVFAIPEKKLAEPIVFPTSFSISLDQSRTAPITVSIDALGHFQAVQAPLGYAGTTTQAHVTIGGQTAMTVFLTENAPPDQADAGADAGAADAGTTDAGAADAARADADAGATDAAR